VGIYSGHFDWCARGHHCGLGEHRARPITVDLPMAGRGVLTRVGDRNGRQYAEIRLRVALPEGEPLARRYLVDLLTRLPALVDSGAAPEAAASPGTP
jgi:hypothetical protein